MCLIFFIKFMEIKIDKIIKSKRKSIALEVNDKAELVARVPKRFNPKVLQAFLNSKLDWLKITQQTMRRQLQLSQREFKSGEIFFYLGKKYKLKILKSSGGLCFDGRSFCLSKNRRDQAPELFTVWYKKVALSIFKQRVKFYQQKYNLKINKIKLSSARKRWGSCSSQRNLNFAWRLVMAPLFVIDYIVVHELVHLKYMNHSKRFWCMVENIYPDYKEAEKWLKENSYKLKFF